MMNNLIMIIQMSAAEVDDELYVICMVHGGWEAA